MDTTVLGVGLSNRVLGAEHQFLAGPEHVGRRERARLLGEGAEYGKGPLPTLLATMATSLSPELGLVLLGARSDGIEESLVDCVSASAESARVVRQPQCGLPWRAFDELLRPSGTQPARFLVVGCRTEHEIIGLASMLKSLYPDASVAVSRQLVASGTPDAHFAALRHGLPAMEVEVLLDFEEVLAFLGLPRGPFERFLTGTCPIEPEEVCESLGESRRRIVQSLCMHWSRTSLRPLGGGFSGSSLFLAEGWKGTAQTEPMVVKIDAIRQMRMELEGYHEVKDLLGKHVPSFGYPVCRDGLLGVGMELAAMEGTPETLQETFETATSEEKVAVFLRRLGKAVAMLRRRLYANTGSSDWLAPYRMFEMHTEEQLRCLEENSGFILGYLADSGVEEGWIDSSRLTQLLRVAGANPDGLVGEICTVHGDLNYANIISDAGDNLWFIDWTLSRRGPAEMDFAKLENDVKFVISKDFELEEIERLRRFEEYLLAGPLPGDESELPAALRYARWDLRYRKILSAVRLIRRACLALPGGSDWLVYRTALLRYATRTLSWDLKRGRGECDVPQMLYALHSVELLLMDLVADDFHLKIRAERPADYPERQRISIDEAPWTVECPGYQPPYYIAERVLAASGSNRAGWADPEDTTAICEDLARRPADHRDERGRPLNPRGRTGIAGRGGLGRWGANRSVSIVCVRPNPSDGRPDVLLGKRRSRTMLEISKGFLRHGESEPDAAERIVALATGWACKGRLEGPVFEGYVYDARQTDHAWIETSTFLLEVAGASGMEQGGSRSPFVDNEWWPLESSSVNRVAPVEAGLIREAVKAMAATGRMEPDAATRLLASTG